MNDMKKGDGKGKNGDAVTPISPKVERERFKVQMAANFRNAKPEQLSLMAEAMNDVLIERELAFKEAEKTAEEEIEELPQFDENKEAEKKTNKAKIKKFANDHADKFSSDPLKYLIGRIINRWVILPLAGASALKTGVNLYSAESIRASDVITGPFSAAWDFISNGAGFVHNNASWFVYGAAAALGLSILKRPTWKHRARRASYALLAGSSPTVLTDIWTNLENGAKNLADAANPSLTGAILAGGMVVSFVASWFLSDEIKYDEKKETSPKDSSEKSSLIGTAASGLIWGIYNTIGAIVRLPGKAISAIRPKETAELAPTVEIPAELAPTLHTGGMEPPVEPTTADWHPASEETGEPETDEDDSSGDFLVPLD
jgi:hypothetical protein